MRALRLLPVIAFALAPTLAFAAPQPTPVATYCLSGGTWVACTGSGGGGGGSAPYAATPVGYQQITVSALSTLTVPTGATFAYITPESATIRYRDDGVAPTATVGYPVSVGQQLLYSGTLSAVQIIAQSGTPVVDVLYYK